MRGRGKYGSSRTTENNHRSSFCSSSMTPKKTNKKNKSRTATENGLEQTFGTLVRDPFLSPERTEQEA